MPASPPTLHQQQASLVHRYSAAFDEIDYPVQSRLYQVKEGIRHEEDEPSSSSALEAAPEEDQKHPRLK
eukprot:gene33750-43465_t